MSATETAGAFRFPYGIRNAAFGPDSLRNLSDWLHDADVSRVLILSSRTLATRTSVADHVATVIGDRLVGVFAETRQHVPKEVALAAVNKAREVRADAIVSLGGGSVSDLGKAVAMFTNAPDINTKDDFDRYTVTAETYGGEESPRPSDPLPHWILPTTLSAAEWTWAFSISDLEAGNKATYIFEESMPLGVIMDPHLTLETPAHLWIATGIRAVDHCVEQMYSTEAQPFVSDICASGLRTLVKYLPRSYKEPLDLEARTRCLIAAWESAFGLTNVWLGLSHAIGHQIGARFNVIHGMTSCVIMPHVMQYNMEYALPALSEIAAILSSASGRPVRNAQAAPDLMRQFVADVGMPTRLSELEVDRAAFPEIAKDTLNDMAHLTNPRPISSPDQIVGVLEAAM